MATAEGARWVPAGRTRLGLSLLPPSRRSVVTAVRLRLSPATLPRCSSAIGRCSGKRGAKQPQGVRTFGSTFKNPPGERGRQA